MNRPPKPGDYLIFTHEGRIVEYPTNGAPLETLATWLPDGCQDWAIVWAPSRTQAKKAAERNWEAQDA